MLNSKVYLLNSKQFNLVSLRGVSWGPFLFLTAANRHHCSFVMLNYETQLTRVEPKAHTINDIGKSSDLFKFILFADDITVFFAVKNIEMLSEP